MVAGATASTRQKLSALTSSSSDTADNNATGGHRTTDRPSQNGTSAVKEAGNLHCVLVSSKIWNRCIRYLVKGKEVD